MKESQIINGWKREGRLEGELKKAREDILEVIRARLADPIPEEIRLAVEGTNDPDTLGRWFRSALRTSDISQFRSAMRQAP